MIQLLIIKLGVPNVEGQGILKHKKILEEHALFVLEKVM